MIKGGIPVGELKKFLSYVKEILPMIEYSYHGYKLDRWTYNVDMYNTKVENLGKLVTFDDLPFMAISPNYKKICEKNYFKTVTSDGLSDLDSISYLYTENGIGSVVTSEYIREQLAVDTDLEDTFRLTYNKQRELKNYLFYKETSFGYQSWTYNKVPSNTQNNIEFTISSGMDLLQGFHFGRKKFSTRNSEF